MEILPSLLSFIDSKVRTFKKKISDTAENPSDVAEQIAANLPETIDKTISDPSNFIGGGAGTFISRGSKSWLQSEYIKAIKAKTKGASKEDIWNTTGTRLDTPDMIPRQEISNIRMELLNPGAWKNSSLPNAPGVQYQQGQLVDLIRDPDFERAYPGLLRDTFSKITKRAGDQQEGKFMPDTGRIFAHASDDADILKVLAHELQHAVQKREGFAAGGNSESIITGAIPQADAFFNTWRDKLIQAGNSPKDATNKAAYMAYYNLAGEVEARATASRLYYNSDDRLARPPWLDYQANIPLKDLIVRFNPRTTP